MIIYKTLANRQLCEYSGSDKYINVSAVEIFNQIFNDSQSGIINTINNEPIRFTTKGATTNLHFITKDKILNKNYNTFFARGERELRYQLTRYVDDEKTIPGDLVIIYIDIIGSNCNINVEISSIYKYVLERKSRPDNRYRILIEYPQGTNNAQITTSQNTAAYLARFNIVVLPNSVTFGKSSTLFSTYMLNDCTADFIGVPYNINLECDYFNTIEEII